MSGPGVQILLATWNGGRYLAEQLDSLLAQTHGDWRLLVRDDCSTDATLAVLAEYRERAPDRISILPAGGCSLGAAGSFAALLAAADADYLMFCDQDDVWLPHKIECTMALMHDLELQRGAACPLLVHSDLVVTDEHLHQVAGSLWRFQHSDPVGGVALNRLLTQNAVTGCTVMINRPLRDLALPVPPEAVMHDWWLALVASAFGAVGHVTTGTVLYRQHGANDVGAQGLTLGDVIRRFSRWNEVNEVLRQIRRQGATFLDRYRNRLTPAQREMLEVYGRLNDVNGLLRRWYMLKYRFFYTGILRNVGRLLIG
jgi:glycosyl transferase family 2